MNVSPDIEIAQLLYRSAELVDRRDYHGWYKLFTEDGVYGAYTFENLRSDGVALFVDRGLEQLKERAAFWLGMWQVGRSKTTHLVSNILFDSLNDKEASVRSRFLISRTGYDGQVTLHATGEYQDELVKTPDGWRFRQRRVVVDNETLPSNFTDPL